MKNATVNVLIVVILLTMTACKSADGGDASRFQNSDAPKHNGHITAISSVRDVVNHPSFNGFGQFITIGSWYIRREYAT